MSKFNGLNLRGQESVVPPLDTASMKLQSDLAQKGVPLPESSLPAPDYSAAQANATADIPENTQSTQSVNAGGFGNLDQGAGEQSQDFKLFPDEEVQPFLSEAGRPRTMEEMDRIRAEQQRREAEAANASNTDWQDLQQFKAAYPEAGKASNVGVIHDVALFASDAMTKTATNSFVANSATPVAMSGMTQLKVGMNADAKKVSNASLVSMALGLPILVGASKTEENMKVDTPEANSFAAFIQGELGGAEAWDIKAVNGGIRLDQWQDLIGAGTLKAVKDRRVDANGKPIDPRSLPPTTIQPRVAGAIITKAYEDAGVISIDTDPDGNKYVRLNPIRGQQFYSAATGISEVVNDANKGKSSLIPMSKEGFYRFGRRLIRAGDRKKVNYTAVEAATEAKAITGSIGVITDPVKAFFASVIGAAANKGQPDAKRLVGIHHDDEPTVIKQKMSGWAKQLEYMAGHVRDKMPRYSAYWTDYGSQRMYNDTVDTNAQSTKQFRAVARAIPKPPIPVHTTRMHEGVTKMQAATMLSRINQKTAKKDFNLSAEEQELSFLITWAHAFDLGKKYGIKTDAATLDHLASLVDYQTLSQAAAIGGQLLSIAPKDPAMTINALLNPTAFDPKVLNQGQMSAIQTLLSGSDKETWGYKLQAYIDAYHYLEAKKNKTAFTPKVTTAIDMNSAGRAFLGMDIGNIDVLKRVGLMMQQQWDAAQVGSTGNTQPFGSPRDYFLQIALDQGVDDAFTQDQKELAAKVKAKLSEYSDPAKNSKAASFSKDFGKKVLMTTDYGKPANFHKDNALLFLEDHFDFRDEMLPLFNNSLSDLADAINRIYTKSLTKATSIWQQTLPKNLVEITQMMGEALAPEGFYGEPLSLGGFKYEETGDYTEVAGEKIPHTRKVFDLHAAAEDKRSKEERAEREAPGPGTRARNQIGPILGQYRESVLVMETLRYINGEGKKPADMLFALPVFDNFVLDSNSFLQFRHVANNIVLPKVLAWDIQTSIKKDFEKKFHEFQKKLKDEDGDTVDVGPDGKYYGIQYNLDREYRYLKDSEPSQLPYNMKQLYDYLHSPNSGYVPPGADRPASMFMTKQQALQAVQAMARAKLYRRYSADSKVIDLLAKWCNEGLIAKRDVMRQLQGMFEKGRAAFFT